MGPAGLNLDSVRCVALSSLSLLDAAARANVHAVRQALAAGADVNESNTSGETAVTRTIAGGSWEDVDASDASFRLPDRLAMLRMLLDNNEISLYTLNAPARGVSPLCLAAWLDLSPVVQLLLEAGQDMVAVNGMDIYGATPLMYAARDGRLEIVRLLLAKDARPDFRDVNHRSSIQHALRHPRILWLCEHALRRIRMRDFLGENSRDLVPLPRPFLEWLNHLCTSSNLNEPKHLSSSLSALRHLSNSTNSLIQAIQSADLLRLRSLLFRPDHCYPLGTTSEKLTLLVNLPDSTGWSPIHYCASADHHSLQVLDSLYQAGADVCLYTTSGHETPLHCLAYKARPSRTKEHASAIRAFILHLVRDLRAPLSARDHGMNTCLHIAAEYGRNFDVVAALLACDPSGAIRDMRNANGLTALDVAKPEFRVAFGVDIGPPRSISSASVRTIRPSTSTSIQSMPPLVLRPSISNIRQITAEKSDLDLGNADVHVPTLSHDIMDNLRRITRLLAAETSVDAGACRELLQDTSYIHDRLFSHLRCHVRHAADDLREARALFQQVYAFQRRVRRTVDRVADGSLSGDQDFFHSRRRTNDSGGSEATAMSEADYILVNRKCRSMSDLRASNQDLPITGSDDTSASQLPVASTVVAIDGGVTFPVPTGASGLSGGSTIDNEPGDAPFLAETLRKQSNTEASSGSKEHTWSSPSKLKAWIMKKFKQDVRKLEAEDDIAGKRVDAPYKKVDMLQPYQEKLQFHRDSVDDSTQVTLNSCRRGLAAVRRDLPRIEECLDSAEQFIALANRSIAQAEFRLKKAITCRQSLLEHVLSASSGGHLRHSLSQPCIDRRSSAIDGEDWIDVRPASMSVKAEVRRRTKSASSSMISFSSTLTEGDDDDTRVLHRLLTRKVDARLDGADEEVDKAVAWLRIVKQTLRDSLVSLLPIPTLSPPIPLSKTKGALSFGIFTGVVARSSAVSPTKGEFDQAKEVPTVVTYLAVGCKRKIVIYSWRDGEPQDAQETPLPHSPRAIAFLGTDVLCFGYSVSDYALFSLRTSTMTELTMPVASAPSVSGISNMGMGALSGLGGYMTLGLGTKTRPCVIRVQEGEVLVAKDNNGVIVGTEAKSNRKEQIDWPAPPDELAFIRPYVFSVLPSGTVPASPSESLSSSTASQANFIPTPVVEIRSSISLSVVQTLPFPPISDVATPVITQYAVRLLTTSSLNKSPLFLVTTPMDRATAASAGSTIWQFTMKAWSLQVDELVAVGSYVEALALLETIDVALLPDKEQRQRLVRTLHAVSQFQLGEFEEAISAFIALETNPAKIIALYPDRVAGRLSVSRDQWITLFGGPSQQLETDSNQGSNDGKISFSKDVFPRPPSPKGSIRGSIKTGLENVIKPTAKKDDETASVAGKRKERPKDDFHRSIEALMRYLSDRRPKVAGALEALNITSSQAHEMPSLSSVSLDELFGMASVPLSALTPEELVRFAQIVDTALFKSYLLVRPGLLGPLCRLGNWCEVSEVEEVLRAREKYSELIYLYNGKKMHTQALNLLRELSEKETDRRDQVMPSVNYLQRLGPEFLTQIFDNARWIFDSDADVALEIFTAEEVDLPRQPVAEYLERIKPSICARYIEYLIEERGEQSQLFHDWLADLYLRMTMSAKKQGNEDARSDTYSKLLNFIGTTRTYNVGRLYASLPSEGGRFNHSSLSIIGYKVPIDLFEAKAMLLGRLGRHDSALEVYVYRLRDFLKAEEYCKRVYQPNTGTSTVFLMLLRIYLRPTTSPAVDLLQPALDLISRHSPRLEPTETLKLLPPLVAAKDVQAFLREALRAPVFDTRMVRDISKARQNEVALRLMYLQANRVKITDSRICPQCHKRIGHSVIAVHSPRGEVTHYQCREAFSKKLRKSNS
ncbi:uncharacterized protein FIBRA_00161 [Fibroporia radiculosa]|uniref:CNH domain-containing protein n=1 Tax=Fibroporia radiculosa TaxID=599839 RepID=J7RGI0_9APHY|nr:uncharacterized protein FIBRA_00161 [Fibroporia radiculosa]CCL98167.1 predicted protein [Fibroporia radiculosa]